MTTVLNILLDILVLLAIIIVGTFVIIFIADLILCRVTGYRSIFFKKQSKSEVSIEEETVISEKTSKKEKKSKKSVETEDEGRDLNINEEDVVVYNLNTPIVDVDAINEEEENEEDDDFITNIDFDKAVDEQKEIQSKKSDNTIAKPVNFDADKKSNSEFSELKVTAKEDENFEKILNEVAKISLKEFNAEKKTLNEVKALKEENEKRENEIKLKNEQLAEAKEELDSITKEIEIKKQEIKGLKSSKKEEDFEKQKIKEIDEVKSELEEAKSIISERENELKEIKKQSENVKKEQVEPDELQQIQKEISEYKKIVEETKKELQELKKVKSYEDLEAKKNQELTEAKETLKETKEEVKVKQKEIDELKKEINKIDKQLSKKGTALENEFYEERQAIVSQYNSDIIVYKDEISNKQKEIDSLKQQNLDLSNAMNELKELKEQLAVREEFLIELKNKEFNQEPKIIETIIKDDGLKYANIARMNARLVNILSNTSKIEKEQLLKNSQKKTKK